ncbi:QacE family quaternary ammonium compound efflux SMR transporter [Actinobacteria bacterium YIM 96077]|uniref:QacE family quaternary ammonium compound efflux SMR transporter n=1 Tax=Phytoactinopolyspora halophila TaxID=1981511 RepID=A0A329QXX8_9ACTN|nr:QacE family quaternary ammonium compound efflux SMR transporter [Actinobacteria bacterium YIM 96077]RAW15488.1 QacE family quaternary ammonium compound efflux SMR transporter [Phytoactinopolyspora halophila]
MAALFLAAAISSEVAGAIATRMSNGFRRPGPTTVAVTGVLGAYFFLSQSLVRGMNIGVAYAIWAGSGVAAVALIGAWALGDRLTRVQVAGVVLVVGGVATLQLA